MHGRLLSAKDLAQMQYSQKSLVMDFYLQFFSSNLVFNSDPSQVFRFLVSWDSKSGFASGFGIFKQNRDNPDEIGMVVHSVDITIRTRIRILHSSDSTRETCFDIINLQDVLCTR